MCQKMDKIAAEKLETLIKYVPFIDFILKVDKEKYIKFVNIRSWIVSKGKKYPLSALNKIEMAITTQYKNLLLENNVKIPENITNIFAPMKLKQFVNLCSDEEDDDDDIQNVEKNRNVNTSRTSTQSKKDDESDDDLEIVSIDYVEKQQPSKKVEELSKNNVLKENPDDMDKVSLDILNKIDELTTKGNSLIHEPNIYIYREKDFIEEPELSVKSEESDIFQRRTTTPDELFKRRKDFQDDTVVKQNMVINDDEVEVQNFDTSSKKQKRKDFNQKPIEIISLDSGSDSEACSDYDDNVPSTSKAAALRAKSKSANKSIIEQEKRNTKDNCNKQDDLCNSMDSVFEDIGELIDEWQETNSDISIKSPGPSNKATSEGDDKEKNLLKISCETPGNDENAKDKNVCSLNQDELAELISNKTDVDLDTLSAALEFIKQKDNSSTNISTVKPAETPPPAPPPININFTPPPPVQPLQPPPQVSNVYPFKPTNICYTPQQVTHQHIAPLLPNYPQNTSLPPISTSIPAPRPKVNDPRIIKQLQQIKNSPLMTYNVLNPATAASIMQICQSQQFQQPQQHAPNKQMPPKTHPSNSTSSNTTNSSASITYGEYKRRQHEKKLEEERQREERKAKAELEKRKLLENEIRSKLLSTLDPCKELLTTMWSKNKNNIKNAQENNKNKENFTVEKETSTEESSEAINKSKEVQHNENTLSQSKKSKNKKKRNTSHNKTNDKNHKMNKIFNELKCTVKGFDQIHDYFPIINENENNVNTSKENSNITPRPIGLRRRSSIHALSAISEQLGQQSSDLSDCEMGEKTKTKDNTPRPIGLQRRSSLHALSAISEQLSNSLDSAMSQNSNNSSFPQVAEPKRRLTDTNSSTPYESFSQDTTCPSSKRRKTIDEIIKPTKRAKTLRIVDDDDDDDNSVSSSLGTYPDIKEMVKNFQEEILNGKQPVIKLHRLSQDTIRKYTNKKSKENECNRLKKKCEKVPHNTSDSVPKQTKKIKSNNDCQMTERNTSFCVLCSSKPSDLTNHYIGRHKTESYVARLEWSELDDLTINTPIAKLHPKTRNYRFDRYEVECPFCKDTLLDTFMNLYHHYSAHTGEYAFQCSHCHLTKPYRPDIQSHILHSKTCRNSTTKVLYRYSPNAQYIYLHYCNICNFVQINEANVFKHLREQHDRSQDVPSNVSKCILVAMSDEPDVNETRKSPTPTLTPVPSPVEPATKVATENVEKHVEQVKSNELNFKVDDDDIPVGNEPCFEDEHLDEFSVEDQLKQLHEELPQTSNISINTKQTPVPSPMTVIHCMGTDFRNTTCSMPPVPAHKPILIKNETMDVEEKRLMTPPRPANCNLNELNQNVPTPVEKPPRHQFTTYEKYRSYPQNVNYLGLYKCMIDDCYYSTDCDEEFCQHLASHDASEENVPPSSHQYLQCPYCIIPSEITLDAKQLVEHVRTEHSHMIYQCSMCCYRSCDGSNVKHHQQLHHNTSLNSCKIFKCSSDHTQDLNDHNKRIKPDLDALLEKNISYICCKFCDTSFYHTQLLVNHWSTVHNRTHDNELKIYSCIYCPLVMENLNVLRKHVAIKHPGETPLIYDHNTQCNNINEDFKTTLDIVEITETVDCTEVKSAVNDIIGEQQEDLCQDAIDIKPSLKELMRMNEETIKVRLRKLTSHTGIPPDNLYRCPEQTCGGFFSTFHLWLRHMKVRHHCIECKCPHCPLEHPLQQFEYHFEQHLRHTFICFHCSSTYVNEELAKQHAIAEHANLEQMRFEKIRFNISYSYSIMIQEVLHKEREHFIAEFLAILDQRLKDLECNEVKKLKQQWPVPDNAPWVDDYVESLQKRKVTRTCLITDCRFRTTNVDYLFEHLRTTHVIKDMTFNCSTCDFRLENCNSFDDIVNHIRIHNGNMCICTACTSLTTINRSKMSLHIEEQHNARDVPIIQLFKNNQQLFMAIYIVFAEDRLTFSTMKNCFCCPEKNMDGDVFVLHLKRYHKFSLNYFCEKCKCNFKSLKEVKLHFQELHTSQKVKIRCKLAAHHELSLTSLNDFQIKILSETSQQQAQSQPMPSSVIKIKDEPMDVTDDDNVIILEDNDVIIQNALKEAKLQEPMEIPKIKCAALSKLQEAKEKPRIKCTPLGTLMQTGTSNNTISTSSALLQTTSVSKQNAASFQGNLYNNNASAGINTNVFLNNSTNQNESATLYINYNNSSEKLRQLQPPTYSNRINQPIPNNNLYNEIRHLQTPYVINNNNETNTRILLTPQNYNATPQPLNVPYNVLRSHTNTAATTTNDPR